MMTEKTNPSSDPRGQDRVLILMRHAKSDWNDESLSDHDRPLNERGQRDAPRMAQWIAENDLIPDVILSSSSVRTRETVGLMTDEWSIEPTISLSETLYLATPEAILRTVRSDACDARRLMVVAHNPGMAHLVSSLGDQIIEMPTAAIAVFQLSDLDWSEVQSSTPMRLVHFMRPKAL
jgi:phosphohistidine phosphatase